MWHIASLAQQTAYSGTGLDQSFCAVCFQWCSDTEHTLRWLQSAACALLRVVMPLHQLSATKRCAQVLVWSIADHVTTLTATGKMHNAVKGERLQNRTKLEVQAPPATLPRC